MAADGFVPPGCVWVSRALGRWAVKSLSWKLPTDLGTHTLPGQRGARGWACRWVLCVRIVPCSLPQSCPAQILPKSCPAPCPNPAQSLPESCPNPALLPAPILPLPAGHLLQGAAPCGAGSGLQALIPPCSTSTVLGAATLSELQMGKLRQGTVACTRSYSERPGGRRGRGVLCRAPHGCCRCCAWCGVLGSPACSGWVGRSRVPPARGPARSITPGWELLPGSAGAPGSSLPHTSATAHRAGLCAAPGTDERRPQHLPARGSSRGSSYGRPGGRRHPANVSQQREGLCTVASVTGSNITLEGRHPGSCWPFCVPVRNRGLRLRPRLGGQRNGLGAAGSAGQGSACCGVCGGSTMGW